MAALEPGEDGEVLLVGGTGVVEDGEGHYHAAFELEGGGNGVDSAEGGEGEDVDLDGFGVRWCCGQVRFALEIVCER